MSREAEVLEMPKGDMSVTAARRVSQGRAVVERYVERLRTATERLERPEASEIYCALAELREGMIENDPDEAESYYRKALELFPQSHVANTGLRRLNRLRGDFEEMLASLECELKVTSNEERRRALQLELVRTYLYCACDAEKAIAILESMDSADSDASTMESETAEFDPEVFLLWEDALLATGAWDRYEGKLREALRLQSGTGAMTQHLEERLWMLYRYIMPDEAQTRILCGHLMRLQPLDDELVDDELMRALAEENHDNAVAVLKKALERLEGSPREGFYRALLADIAAYEYEDKNHAIDVLADEACRNSANLLLLNQQKMLLSDSARAEDMLNVMARGLELLSTPEQKAEQLYEIACIMRDDLENDEAALDVFGEANETCPTHEPTIEALADIYTKSGEWEQLARLYEFELSYAIEHQRPEYTPEVFTARHSRLAELYERLQFALNAFNHYQAILNIRPDDIAALKGASRMAQINGNWTELLQLYAAAEGCTQDTREHSYLLKRIAQIAEVNLNDADTACTALEALRSMDPKYSTMLASLARLYVKLGKWDALIALTDEEIAAENDPEYKATLLCRNGEVSEVSLSNIPQAVLYYEKARSVYNSSRQAASALERLYRFQKAWEKLADLYKSEASLTSDATLKCACLRHMAEVLDVELDSEEEAVIVYETCLKIKNTDTSSRRYLLRYYHQHEQWEDVLRILGIELKAGGTKGVPWLTLYWMGRIELYLLHDEARALKSFGAAFESHPDDITLLRTWLMLARKTGHCEEARETLGNVLENVTSDAARADIEIALADLTLSASHDPRTLELFAAKPDIMTRYKSSGARFVSTVLVANDSAAGRWTSRLAIAFQPRQSRELHRHALLASIVLALPESIRDRAHSVLCDLSDLELARKLWAFLTPAQRPDFRRLPPEILEKSSHESQDLRRWLVISMLLNGEIDDPTDVLLPDDRDDSISYRPDLELLASYFEKFECWNKLLEVLSVQEMNSRNEPECIQIAIQRAWVLSKIRRPEEALECIRDACRQASFDNDVRLTLYDYLEHQKDWDFLAEQIRRHLMNSTDKLEICSLWMRLANIYKIGMNNLEEALRCLDSAYQADNTRGDILCEISETAEQIDELDIARRALDDYIRYHAPTLEEQFALEPRLLELHFRKPGGDPQRLLVYFDDLLRKSVDARDCKIVLAKAHAIAGDPARAAQLILSVVDHAFVHDDIELWIILADVYLDRLNEQKQGEEILWKLFRTYPGVDYVFDRLNRLYTTPAERKIFVVNIENSVSSSEAISGDSALVRKYLGIAAKILGSELGAWQEAQDLYSRALDASSEPSADLVKNRAYARCRVPGEAKSAYGEFCQLLVEDPFQPDIYRAAFEICRRNRAADRERILKQLAQVFVSDSDLDLSSNEVRPKLMDSRPLSDDILLKHLTPKPLRSAQIILHDAMPIFARVLRDDVPRRTSLGGEKVRDPQILDLFNRCAAAFGVQNVRGYVGHDVCPWPVVLDEPPSYWIDMDTWMTMKTESRRHWAGFAGGMLWTGLSRLLYSDARTVWQLLDGIYFLVTGNGITERNAYTKEAADRVDAILERGLRRNVASLIDAVGRENLPITDAPAWLDCINATADRAGLMFSGSLTASLPAILEAEGWNPKNASPEYLAARYKQSKRLARLVAFALSDDYLELRFHAGLSVQPSTISG